MADLSKDLKVFAKLLEERYYLAPPSNIIPVPVEKSSLELQKEFEENCEPTLAEISDYLFSQNTEFFFGSWRLYEKFPEPDYIQHFDPD